MGYQLAQFYRAFILFFGCLFLFVTAAAQPVIKENSFLVKPGFRIGDSKTYLVTEETKNELGRIKSTNQFKVTISIQDTAKGYTISYKMELLKTTNRNLTLSSVVAKISNNLVLVYKMNKEGFVTRIVNLREAREKLIRSLDSLVKIESFNKHDATLNSVLRQTLSEPGGIQICLESLMIFNNAYIHNEFRKQKDFVPAERYTIFNVPTIPGTLIKEFKKLNAQENYAQVSLDFKGNRDSAAKYNAPLFQQVYTGLKGKPYKAANLPAEMRNDFEREYDINISDGWPRRIYDRSVEFYFEKITKKTTITIADN